jgi:hypothetical protein
MSKVYEVEEFSMGSKHDADKIIFKSVDDMEQAYQDIDNGKDIYVVKDGLVTKFLHQMINAKIYDGTIQLSARKQKGEKVKGEEND